MKEKINREELVAELKKIYFDPNCISTHKYDTGRITIRFLPTKTPYNLIDEDKRSYIYATVYNNNVHVAILQQSMETYCADTDYVYGDNHKDIKGLAKTLNDIIMKMFNVKEF